MRSRKICALSALSLLPAAAHALVYQPPMPVPAPGAAPNDPGHDDADPDDADRNDREYEPALR